MQKQILEKLLATLKQLLALLQKRLDIEVKKKEFQVVEDKNEVIYQTARNLLGQKIRTVSRELACADVLNNLYIRATGRPIGGTTSTLRMYNSLITDKRFTAVKPEDRKRGDIILSPTGNHLRTKVTEVSSGHCGILLDDDIIGSNNSLTGLLDDHWSFGKWLYYYRDTNGFQVTIWRLV